MRAPTVQAARWLPAILVLSAVLNLANLDFPFTFHGDESRKVQFIQQSIQNFNHPILMLQLVRTLKLGLGMTRDGDIALLGRALMALCATATVLLAYVLARRTFSAAGALAVAAATAVSPTLVIHAHYLKEDTILTTCLMASILLFLRFAARLDFSSAALLGIGTGLAFSSHYKSILLVPLYLIAPLLGLRASASRFYAMLLVAGAVATAVFVSINWPLLFDLQLFYSGVLFEMEHATLGHDVPIDWNDYWLGFHLIHSLVPGIGALATILAIAGLAMAIARWSTTPFRDRWLLAYVLVFYLVPEVSPLKPWPDFLRYMVPLVPPLLYFAWQAVERGANLWQTRGPRTLLLATGVVALIVVPMYMSTRLVIGLANDTRVRASIWIQQNPGTAILDDYSGETPANTTVGLLDPDSIRAQGIDYLVANSFMYERFAAGARLKNQEPRTYQADAGYQALFALPYVEFAPDYRSFAFSNPVIRIIDLRQPRP